MAHKKIAPADRNAPPTDHHRTMNPPVADSSHKPRSPGEDQTDIKHRQGAFAGRGRHAMQQQMGNRD